MCTLIGKIDTQTNLNRKEKGLKNYFLLACSVIFTFAATFGLVSVCQARNQLICIGTGGVTGVYYSTGGAICRLINKGRKEHGIGCTYESTGGSVYNLNALAGGHLELAIVQSDSQYKAYNGIDHFAGNANPDLRSVFSLHVEPLNIVARADSGIGKFEDLKGKRVFWGDPGSGQRLTMGILMDKLGWTKDDFKGASDMAAVEMSSALCDNEIDAFSYVVGVPNGSIRAATANCDAVMINVTGTAVDELVAENNYYRYAVIPAGTYRGSDDDVNTFGVVATLVTLATVSEDVIYTLVKTVFENFDDFKKLHPALASLKKEEMVKDGLTAPLHPGALKYYKEIGLL